MDKTTSFPISLPGYAIEGLIGSDAQRLVRLYRACADYIMMERGEEPGEAIANEEFEHFPPGRTAADKFVFGLKGADGAFAGVLSCDRDYPRPGCWWIALLMIDKSARGQGVGQGLCRDFFSWLTSQQAERVELGVLSQNGQGLRFWRGLGFDPVRTAGPISIGARQHMVEVLGRAL